jgi:hypothetical protein
MTVFCGQGLFPAELILYFSTVTSSFPFDIKVLCFVVDTVWFSVFPFVFLAVGGIASLVLVLFLLSRHRGETSRLQRCRLDGMLQYHSAA